MPANRHRSTDIGLEPMISPMSRRDTYEFRRAATAALAVFLLIPYLGWPLAVLLVIRGLQKFQRASQLAQLRWRLQQLHKFCQPAVARVDPRYVIERIRMRALAMGCWLVLAQLPMRTAIALPEEFGLGAVELLAFCKVVHALQTLLTVGVAAVFLVGLRRELHRLVRLSQVKPP